MGVNTKLANKLNYLWRSCTDELSEQNDLFRLTYTQMRHADAPAGLIQPLACSEASSEQTHGLRGGSTKLNTITRNIFWTLFPIVPKCPG
ncbi:hypothetical protein D6J78_24700 [Salmonella enterica subsp. enterica serovar Abaetetuba]|nr:hypothetical protein [Salmonella enterica subsp. enterica serovar Abaetetuba]ECC6794327.1 hypothetical protein [Salmonella enterica]ECD1969837.1 hypothetical protein [Salmonella enterica subsp. enterica serovar Abaetetuba]